jgi:hypothetical protein
MDGVRRQAQRGPIGDFGLKNLPDLIDGEIRQGVALWTMMAMPS